MKTRIWIFGIIFAAGALTLNIFAVRHYFDYNSGHASRTKRIDLVRGIDVKLDELEDEVWGIISVYDPRRGKKVDPKELNQYYEITRQIIESINLALSLTKDSDIQIQLEILNRSVDSLAKRIEAIKDKLEMKKMDEESTLLLFPDAVNTTMLSESYVDELENATEQIRFVKGVISKNIDKYMISELNGLQKENKQVDKSNKQLVAVNIIAGVAMLIAALLLQKDASRIKD